jgi:hypothetical protein
MPQSYRACVWVCLPGAFCLNRWELIAFLEDRLRFGCPMVGGVRNGCDAACRSLSSLETETATSMRTEYNFMVKNGSIPHHHLSQILPLQVGHRRFRIRQTHRDE